MDILKLFSIHKTASNALMILIILFGLLGLTKLNVQSLPDFGFDLITVSVDWKSASPRDVENRIIKSIEPKLRIIDGVRNVNSTSREGLAQLSIEFVKDTDMQRALSDVTSTVDRILSLPEDAEKPKIRRIIRYETVGRVLLYGDVSEEKLRENAQKIRDDLLNLGIDKINILGMRNKEINILLNSLSLMRFNLSLEEISNKIFSLSEDVPIGTIEDSERRKIKFFGEKNNIDQIADLEIKIGKEGEKILLSDVAEIDMVFDKEGQYGLINGKRAISLDVKRASGRDALKMANILENYVSEFKNTTLSNVQLKIYDLSVQSVRDRISLLIKNGLGGLVLVVSILFLFLSGKVAFWVAFGIPIALSGTLGVMLVSGQSINMVSLFALIMMLGIIVDDAIVVAEHAQFRHDSGINPENSAYDGARTMFIPVFTAAITTVAAFIPIFLITGIIGQVIEAIPLVAIAVLIASLIECFLILPGHLTMALSIDKLNISKFRIKFNDNFNRFKNNTFNRFVTLAVKYRYTTLSIVFASLILVLGIMIGGRVAFVFFPSPEPDIIYANFNFSPGTNKSKTEEMILNLEKSLSKADVNKEVKTYFSVVGRSLGLPGSVNQIQGQHMGSMIVELLPSDKRITRVDSLISLWRKNLDKVAGLEALSIISKRQGPPGKDIDIRITPNDKSEKIIKSKYVASEIKSLLSNYEGVTDIYDDLPWGKEELVLELKPLARSMNMTILDIANQIQAAFSGVVARRFSDGMEEILIRVKYDDSNLKEYDLKNMLILSQDRDFIPLYQLTDIKYDKGFSIIRRENGQSEVSITAELDESVTSPATILTELSNGPLDLIAKENNFSWRFSGRSEEQKETLNDMKLGTIIGLIIIYIILSAIFSSYSRPLIVMSIIPFAALGSIIGHWVTGYDMTILSLVALLGLSGIVINDSIIMVSTINKKIREGLIIFSAAIEGAKERLRAVFLTSLTTICGLTPLLFERSTQAQFLKPMVITIVFGLIATTFLVLFLVPSLIVIQNDIKIFFKKIKLIS
tara:strand:- start:7633 stop:10728 length:3096 start_codon:yes stop_codon:yes gene_type:complete